MGDRQHAVALYNQGIQALQDKSDPKMVPHAYQLFASACHADPTWWQGFYQAGNNNSDLNLHQASIACWRRALEGEINPQERAKVLTNLGWRLHTIGQTQEAYAVSMQALDYDSSLPSAWRNLSLIHGVLGSPAMGVQCARKAWALLPDDKDTEFLLAFALLFNRELVEGFKHFEARFAYRLKEYLQYPYPKWQGELDKIVYLVSDQGLGDTLSFARFVQRACERSKQVIARIQPELYRLFLNSLGTIPNLTLVPTPYPFPAADCWTTFVSLPTILGLTDEEIRNTPQIAVPNVYMPVPWKSTDRKLHVGIAWAGSPLNDIDKHRSFPVEHFFELYRIPGLQLYSLQIGAKGKDMHDIGGAAIIRDITQYISDVTDTLAILNDLDLVICCESALAHICAAAGKECWIPYSHLGRDYRIGLDGSDMLWTPHHRLFRQGPDMKWEPVFAAIGEALRERVHAVAGASQKRVA